MATNINFLLTISIDCQEQSLGELISWLQTDQSLIFYQILSTNFFKEMYGDQSGEFVWISRYWGQNQAWSHNMWGGVEYFWCVINNGNGWSVLVCWICLRRGSISNTNANKLINSSAGLKKEKRIGIGLQ